MDIKFNEKLKYKDVCEMLGDEFLEAKGNKRLNQLKRWNKKYIVKKDKTWYTVERPLNEVELEIVNNENTFTANIERILLREIKLNGTGYQAVLTTKELFEKFKLVNDKYYKAMFKDFNEVLNEILAEYEVFDYKGNCEQKYNSKQQAKNELRTYLNESKSLLRTTLFDCLKSLQKKDLIIYSKSFKLTRKRNGFIESYITTPEEDSIILGIIDDVKKEQGITGSLHFLTSFQIVDYYNRINELVFERFGYDYCHEATRIILSEKAIQRDLDRIEVIINSMKNNNDKAVKKLKESKVLTDKMSNKRVECFTDKLIKIGK